LTALARECEHLLPSYEFRGQYLLHPVREHVIGGIAFSQSEKGKRYLHWFVMPLAPETAVIGLDFGERFPRPRGRAGSEPPVAVEGGDEVIRECARLVHDAAQTFVENHLTLAAIWAYARDHSHDSIHKVFLRIAYLIWSGSFDEALEATLNEIRLIEAAMDSRSWVVVKREELLAVRDALSGGGIDCARKLLTRFEQKTLINLGLGERRHEL